MPSIVRIQPPAPPIWLRPLLAVAAVSLLCSTVAAQSETEIRAKFLFGSFTFTTQDGVAITRPYRLFVPDDYDDRVSYPIVVTLHGRGEVGNNNVSPLHSGRLATAWADTTNQKRHRAFVLLPQGSADFEGPIYQGTNAPDYLVALIDSLKTAFSIDDDRVYITGLSMGGDGTLVSVMAHPNYFAAAAPVAAYSLPERPEALAHLPMWTLHGRQDDLVDVSRSRAWAEAFTALGIPPVLLECDPNGGCLQRSECSRRLMVYRRRKVYTEYEHESHNFLDRAYEDPVLIDWIFDQRRGQATVGRFGTVLTFDIDAAAIQNAAPEHVVGIVGDRFPLDPTEPLTLCEDLAEDVFGGTVAFADTTTGSLNYQFVHFDPDDRDAGFAEGRPRSLDMGGSPQLAPYGFWNDQGAQAPDVPVLLRPDSSAYALVPVHMEWSPGGTLGRYVFEMDTVATFESEALTSDLRRLPDMTVSQADTLTTYYWRVRAENDAGVSGWTPTWSFRPVGITPELLAPASGEETQNGLNTVDLVWAPYPGKDSYEVSISNNADFSEATTQLVRRRTTFSFGPLEPLTDYYWRVRWLFSGQWSAARGFSTPASVGVASGLTPVRFSLSQSQPNPAHGLVTIGYSLPESATIDLALIDLLGRRLLGLDNGYRGAGSHEVTFNASTLPSGVYFYALLTNTQRAVKPMVIAR